MTLPTKGEFTLEALRRLIAEELRRYDRRFRRSLRELEKHRTRFPERDDWDDLYNDDLEDIEDEDQEEEDP